MRVPLAVGRVVVIVAFASLLGVAGGCATGGVLHYAQRTERPVRVERAARDGERLWLVYDARLETHDGNELATRRRAASLQLADLAPGAVHPLDPFPRAAAPLEDALNPALERVALVGPLAPTGAVREPLAALPTLRVETREDGTLALTLHGVAGLEAGTTLRSDALVERRLAAWGWPLFPLAVALDAVAAPPLALLGLALFGWND